jgi:hypothetical protein
MALWRSQRRFSNGVTGVATPFQSSGNSVGAVSLRFADPREGAEHPAAVLDCDLELVALRETRF